MRLWTDLHQERSHTSPWTCQHPRLDTRLYAQLFKIRYTPLRSPRKIRYTPSRSARWDGVHAFTLHAFTAPSTIRQVDSSPFSSKQRNCIFFAKMSATHQDPVTSSTEKVDTPPQATPDKPVGPPAAHGEVEYPPFAKLAVILFAVCICVFLVALDQTIIAPALGAITSEFHSTKDIVSVFLLCCASQL